MVPLRSRARPLIPEAFWMLTPAGNMWVWIRVSPSSKSLQAVVANNNVSWAVLPAWSNKDQEVCGLAISSSKEREDVGGVREPHRHWLFTPLTNKCPHLEAGDRCRWSRRAGQQKRQSLTTNKTDCDQVKVTVDIPWLIKGIIQRNEVYVS